MPKQPRRPRAVKRGTDAKPERVSSRIVTIRHDLRQAGLFDLPPTWIAPAIPTLVLRMAHDVLAEAAQWLCRWRADPLLFVQEAFPWGRQGLLNEHQGPDVWQAVG